MSSFLELSPPPECSDSWHHHEPVSFPFRKSGSIYVGQAGFKLITVFLPWCPERKDSEHVPPHPAYPTPSLARLLKLATPHPQGRQIKSLQVLSSEKSTLCSDLSH